MTGVDLKSLLDKCNPLSTVALSNAAGQAVTRTHYEVTIEHFFLACLATPKSDIPLILEHFGLDLGQVNRLFNATLDDFRFGNSARPVFSPLLIELLEKAWLLGSVNLGQAQIRTGTVLLAFLSQNTAYTEAFRAISFDNLSRDFAKLTAESLEAESLSPTNAEVKPGTSGFLAKYCEDFTAKARKGQIDPVFGRDAEIRQMVDILARRRKNNPILVGEPGVGKTAVLEGLALRIVEGDVPQVLEGVTLLSLDLGLLEAGAGMKGEFERRLKGVLDEIKSSEAPIILFIDEAHMLVGAGGGGGTGSDAANLMKPALARGEIRTCAATTWKEYKKYFEKDPALARRFQLVKLEEPSVETATLILRGIRASYEEAHKVLIRDDAIVAAANLANRYITGRFLPDKAIDLLDTACARVKVTLTSKPASLENKLHAKAAFERELYGLKRDQKNGVEVDLEKISSLEEQISKLQEEAETLEAKWQEERKAAYDFMEKRNLSLDNSCENQADLQAAKDTLEELQKDGALIQVEVTSEVVAKVVSDWTGIPVGRMAQEQAVVVKDLNARLTSRVKGQDLALNALTKGIQAAFAGLRSPNQPLGVFLLVGPSGVGKTETGLALAELLFGDEKCVTTINLSEFQEKHTVSRLIGSPPGYVGYGEGGMLTEAVRRRPYSVVLLDEAEKAHLDVLNLFYQVFDKGTLTDGEGKEVSFKNTIILLTSNLASDLIQELTKDNAEVDLETMLSVIRPVLSDHFRPALLGRMTIVPYRTLESSALTRITELKLQNIASRLKENKDMTLTFSPEVLDQIVARCVDTETGARNIDYILAGSVLPRLAHSILEHMSDAALPTQVTLGVASDGTFTMDLT